MCTALTYKSTSHYFGRNLDLDYTLGEQIVITPRNYGFDFKMLPSLKSHYAIIGVAKIDGNYPLYYDATNEVGLSACGLNFPETAVYFKPEKGKKNIAPFEIIPYILGKFKNIDEVVDFLKAANIADIVYSDDYPLTPLHWIIADKNRAITLESVKDGIKIYENPVGVLTNNPTFDIQMFNLSNFMSVSAQEPQNRFSDKVILKAYSRGMGGIGIPGDLSSMSRFVKACFTKLNSVCGNSEAEAVNQFFHILHSVCQQRGCVKVGEEYEITNYTSCVGQLERGQYFRQFFTCFICKRRQIHKLFRPSVFSFRFMIFTVNFIGKSGLVNEG